MQKISILFSLLGSITCIAQDAETQIPAQEQEVVLLERNPVLEGLEPIQTFNTDFSLSTTPPTPAGAMVATKNWKISSGVDNTGTNPIGPIRIFSRLDLDHFLFDNHTLKIQATTADHFNELQTYTVEYKGTLPWENSFKVFGSYSDSAPHRADFPQKHRETYQASGRYIIPYAFKANRLIDEMAIETGFDFKGTNTNILFEDDAAPVEKRLAYVSQFVAGLTGLRERDGSKITAGVDFVGSPAKILPHQTTVDYNNLRTGATPEYFYSRLSFTVDQTVLRDWKVFLQGRTQLSISNLIPSEQFALGGYNTVRGYDEKVVNGDNAVCANLELRSPEFSVAGIWFPKWDDSLTVIGFVDSGYAWYRQEVENTPLIQTLLGFGPGLRYDVSSYFSSRLDVGFPVLAVEKDSGKPHIHFNAILSY